jgi:hypothetical protein
MPRNEQCLSIHFHSFLSIHFCQLQHRNREGERFETFLFSESPVKIHELMATVQAIREALQEQPFRRFDLKLVDGRRFTITHPDFVMIPPIPHVREIIVSTPTDEEPGSYRAHRLELGLILEVTIPTDAPPPTARPAAGQDGH